MKKLLLVLVIAAQANALVGKDAEMEKLASEFRSIDYMNPSARAKGEKMVPEALKHSQRLVEQKTKTATLETEFRALVKLIAASNPYDVETAGAGDLVEVMKRFSLQSVYEQELKSLSSACEKENLAYYVGQRLCKESECTKIPVVREYEDCLLAQKSKKK